MTHDIEDPVLDALALLPKGPLRTKACLKYGMLVGQGIKLEREIQRIKKEKHDRT